MIKIRLRFSKTGPLRFIGHLDFLKVFQQTVARAKLPIAYSQGFNPHMLMSFALPLPLGMTSLGDYADIVLEAGMPEDEIISRLNAYSPEGLTVTGARGFSGQGAAAVVAAADYAFPAELLPEGKAHEIIQNLLARESIVIPKKTKSGVKDTDIRPDILDIKISDECRNIPEISAIESENQNCVLMRLVAGSARFLNPLIVAGLLLGHDADPSAITRVELYRKTAGSDNFDRLVPLYEAAAG